MNNSEHIPWRYKTIPLGIIPREWEIKQIRDIGKVVTGFTPPINDETYFGSEYMFVTPADIRDTKYITNTERKLSLKGFSVSRKLPKGSVLFTCIGSTIGKMAIAAIDLTSNQQINAIICKEIDNDYLFYELFYQRNYIRLLAGEQAVPIINKSTFERIRILVPPIEEQKKIAEILSEWDKAIELQTKLIEKLEMRKRALMQRLLTGRVRLNGYSVEWENVRLEQIISLAKGEQYNKVLLQKDDKYPVINGGIIPSGYTDKYNSEANTITISEGGNSCGYVNLMTTRFWCGGHCYAVKEKDMVHKLFLYQLLKYHEPIIMRLRVGSGLPNIQMKTLQKYRLRIPPFPEQANIASILITTDREIDLEKQRLSSLRTQKRGLMQQLLTGEKRILL